LVSTLTLPFLIDSDIELLVPALLFVAEAVAVAVAVVFVFINELIVYFFFFRKI